MVGANMKQTWERIFQEALAASPLPKGLARVLVEGTIEAHLEQASAAVDAV